MADFGDHVGIRFLEAMSGYARGGGQRWVQADDAGRFSFELLIEIPRLREFLDAPLHEARIASGTVEWTPFVKRTPVNPGRFVLFRAEPGTRRRKFFDSHFSFPSGVGFDIHFEGHKDLKDDGGFDAATDLTTVFLTLSAQDQPIARGVVNVGAGELIRQLESIAITGASSAAEERAAKEAFFAFMNTELRQVYKNIPTILREDKRLSTEEWRTLRLCARVMLPDPLPAEGPTIDEVIENLERYVAHAPVGQVRDIRNALQAVGVALPILGADVAAIRRFVARELRREARSPVRDVLDQIHTLVAFPYYAHPKADSVVGYERPKHVSRSPADGSADLPVMDAPPDRTFDVVIAGSGPAGSLLADRLTAQGKSVLLIEEGAYVRERQIDNDELIWTARLYKRSALQRANEARSIFEDRGPSFMVLQGGCLGGGSVVNNAVCFRMSAHRLAQWRNIGFPLDAAALDAGYGATAAELSIGPVSERARRLNPGGAFLEARLGPAAPPSVDVYPDTGLWECLVNLETLGVGDRGCLGLGLCNVGCGSERKRNALQVYLPNAAARGCTIVADARAQEVRLSGVPGGQRVDGLVVRLRDGREVTVRGHEYVLSCGPIGSSEVLLRSRDLRDRIRDGALPVGRRVSANLGSPLFAFTRQQVNRVPGLQIAHAYIPPDSGTSFVLETWFNPPGANALAMPGYMAEHHARMKRFAHTIAGAPLVGSRPVGSVALENGRTAVRLPVGPFELDRLGKGLALLAEALLEGGVESVVVGYGAGRELKNAADIAGLRDVVSRAARDSRKRHLLRVGTGHPQGGNAMSEDPATGVVDDRFRVRGIENLRVCDGSVFPDSSAVNPQWTILALAHHCATLMAQDS